MFKRLITEKIFPFIRKKIVVILVILNVAIILIILLIAYMLGRPNVDKILPGTKEFKLDEFCESFYLNASMNPESKASKATNLIDERINEILTIKNRGLEHLQDDANMAFERTTKVAKNLVDRLNDSNKKDELLKAIGKKLLIYISDLIDQGLNTDTDNEAVKKHLDLFIDVVGKISSDENKVEVLNSYPQKLTKIAEQFPEQIQELVEQLPDDVKNRLDQSIVRIDNPQSQPSQPSNNQPVIKYDRIADFKIADAVTALDKEISSIPYLVSNINLLADKGLFSITFYPGTEITNHTDEVATSLFANKGGVFGHILTLDGDSSDIEVYQQNPGIFGGATLDEFLWLVSQLSHNFLPKTSSEIPIYTYENF